MISTTARGLLAAVGVMCVWSGFFVFSRAGVQTPLTGYDLAALRFIVAGLVVLPFVGRWWPYHLPPKVILLMALTGPGVVYSTLMYFGLKEASVAYGGVFANGFLPVFTAGIALLVSRQSPSRNLLIAIATIVAGGVAIGVPGMIATWRSGADIAKGIVLFLAASAILSIYIDGVKRFGLKPKEALAVITLPNALFFLPIWYLALPSGLAETDMPTIVFQALFQGLGPGFLAVILFAIAATHLGATPTAGFSAAVPATATLMAIPVLGEVPSWLEWLGLAIVTVGLVLLIRPGKKAQAA